MRNIRALGFCLLLLPTITGGVAARTDPLVEEMVAAVSQARVTATVQTLQDFQTRYTYTDGNTAAGNWLFDFFSNLGLVVERHPFTFSGDTEDNIVARMPGSTLPEEIVIISGHFDSTSENPNNLAPGADDDASAIAAVLEAAAVLRNYHFDRTIEFICFNAEEQGRKGSTALAVEYLAAGRHIVAVLNIDMIGYWPTGWQRTLDVAYDPVSASLASQVVAACQSYVGIPATAHPTGMCQDDHYSFTTRGIPAVTSMDCWDAHNGGGETTPNYHRTTDTISTLNLPCMTQAVQVNVASLAVIAGPESPVGFDPARGNFRPAELDLAIQPNPVHGGGVIAYRAPVAGTAQLRIIDAAGRSAREFVSDGTAGLRRFAWSGTDQGGRRLPSGVYFLELTTGSGRTTEKFVFER